jgi:hypothetical protein
MKDGISEMRKRIEGIESQVGILPRAWVATPSTAKKIPAAKNK